MAVMGNGVDGALVPSYVAVGAQPARATVTALLLKMAETLAPSLEAPFKLMLATHKGVPHA